MAAEIESLRKECVTPGVLNALYDIGAVVGKGGFSTVRSGKTKSSPAREVALKILNPRAYMRDPAAARQIFHEIKVMKRVNALNHPNLMQFIAAHEDIAASTGLPRLTIVTPLYSGGELFDRIVARGHYSEADAAELLGKLTHAFLALHASGIVHRDLKPENVLYESKSDESEPILADFGLSLLQDSVDVHGSLVGTPGYLAPEIISLKIYTPAGDVWSLGVLLYILLCGYPPFYADNNRDLYAIIRAGVFEFHADSWGGVAPAAKDLVSKMLTVDHNTRVTMQQVLEHPWMKAANKDTHMAHAIANLKQFNARRKIKAAVAAVRLGGQLAITRELHTILKDRPFTEEEVAALSKAFHDVTGRGTAVSQSQFEAVMKSLGLDALPLDRIFALFDEDGSGDIDYKELLCGFARLKGDSEAAVRMCFQIFDENGDGSLSFHELVRLLRATGLGEESLSSTGGAASTAVATDDDKAKALETLFERIDVNKDGLLSYDEFKAAVDSEPILTSAIFKPFQRALSGRSVTSTE